MKRLRVLIATGLAVLVLVIGLTLRDWQRTMDLTESSEPQGPNLVMEGIQARGFSTEGRPEYWLRALAANRYDGNPPYTLLSMPWLEVREENRHWVANGQRGRVEGDNERLVLQGRVNGRRLSPPEPPLALETEELRYTPDNGELIAPGPVRIEHEGGHTRAGSMRGRRTEDRLELLEGVETRYVPPS